MPGETGLGTWVAYGVIVAFLLLVLLLFLRTAVMVSLLWLAPAAALARRVPVLRGLLPAAEGRPDEATGSAGER